MLNVAVLSGSSDRIGQLLIKLKWIQTHTHKLHHENADLFKLSFKEESYAEIFPIKF